MSSQAQQPKGPSASAWLGGVADVAGALSPFLPGIGGVLGIAEGVGGFGKEATGDSPNIFGAAGGISKALGGVLSLTSEAGDLLPDVAGGMGNAFGVITGTMDMLDEEKSAPDRVVGGVDALANGLGLGGTIGGASLTGAGVGGASTLLSSGAGAALGAGGATAATAGGAVLAAGVGGYKVGSLLANAADSEYGRDADIWGVDPYSGRARTGYDWASDTAVSADQAVAGWTGSETLGTIAGGATALGTGVVAGLGGAATAGWNYLFGD